MLKQVTSFYNLLFGIIRKSQLRLNFPKWFRQGIESVGDLIDKDRKFISELELATKFNLTGLNFLEIFKA